MAWRGSFSVNGEGIRCACGSWSFSWLISIAFARWALVHGTIFLARGVTLSMAGNARRGPHCIGIVFLCQKWRLWGLFFAGRDFAMKSMLPPIRQNVFIVAGHSAFLELLTLQKGPIVPLSATTPLFGRNGRFGGTRRRCACSLSAVCRLASGACHSVWPLPSAPGLSALSLAASPLALAPFRPRNAFRRLLRALAIPPIAVCRTSVLLVRR